MTGTPSASSAPLPRIRLLATGGTIAGAQTDAVARGYHAAAFSIDALVAAVPQLATLARLDVEQVAAIGSQDMDEGVWLQLAARTEAALAQPDIAGIVVTHGTDTMEETAFFLNLVVRSAKPVVLVGAMRPATAISADGPMNLYNAVAVAAHPDTHGRGVLVVANDEIHFAREVAKTNTTQLGTFRATHRGLAGVVNAGRLHLYAPPVRRHTCTSEFSVAGRSELPRVDIVYAYAGMGRELIDAAVAAGARGIVIAGVGDGNLNARALRAAADAAQRGVVIVRSSRTGGGVVERNIEIDDDRHGFVAADELNPQKARVLLMLALTKTPDPRAVQEIFFTY
ncbi:type II asparaginase [Opitutus terrae]|uniref:L-asparaginase, type II n=1 Tax=Opitutus terrae (strain DSM 11246 / JCM 15787 / PB90-1) TaxID=452637 RepID=B1ZNJ9_OPITP|nr:type II asparaginase [Opitutus terrae]ACB74433.1 L-asparaginase, type II [Opitutus terrae PB90-1]